MECLLYLQTIENKTQREGDTSMCEMLALHSGQPMPIETVLKYATLLDEYGLAGFSWGIVWKTDAGTLKRYRAVEGIRRDSLALRTLEGVASREYLVHLRRPSAMTTIAHRNAQPYLSENGAVGFAHNGYFARHSELRPKYLNCLEGTSDSEVGFFYYQELVSSGVDASKALIQTHQDLEGGANIGVIRNSAPTLFYSGSHDNAVYTFQLDGATVVSTSLHSSDDYLFQSVFPLAERCERIPNGTVFEL